MDELNYPATKSDLQSDINGFEATHNRKPTIAATDEFLLVLDDWTRHRLKSQPPGTNLVEERRSRYKGAKFLGCEIRVGAENFNLE